MQDCLRVVRARHKLAQPHDVAALLHKVFNIIIRALVGQLGHLDALTSKLLIQIKQIQTRWRQILHAWQEHGRLQLGHGRLELGRNQRQRLMLDRERLEQVNRFGHQVSIKLVQVVAEQRGEIFRHFLGLLEAGAETVCQGCNVGHVVMLCDLGVFFDVALKFGVAVIVQQPFEKGLLNFLVVFILKELIREEPNGAEDN